MFRKFSIWLIKNLIILLIAVLIFSTVTLDFPSLLKNVFGDVFEYSSPEMQKQAVNNLAESCSSLDKNENVVTLQQVCSNATLLESMRENCNNYRKLKENGMQIENEQQAMQTCNQIESGEIEKSCNELKQKSSLMPDFSKIGSLCKDLKSGKINDKEFFHEVIAISVPNNTEIPRIDFLDKYNNIISYLINNKILYFIILAILLIILYVLVHDSRLFIITLTSISFSIGTLIMLPYFGILVYQHFVGFDTTPILGSIFGSGSIFDFKAITSIILLLLLRTYNDLILTIGLIFLGIGIAGKIYGWKLRKLESAKAKTEKKSEEKSDKEKIKREL